jgi:CheY-like chemotaxis protein
MKKKLENLRILLVDDDPDILDLLVNQFAVFNLHPSTASSGNEAYKLIQQQEVDVVITDSRMNHGDGMSLLQNIRKDNHSSPNIFFLTGYTDYTLEELYEAGADGLFEKPFSSRALIEAARRAVNPRAIQWNVPPADEPSLHVQRQFSSFEDAINSGDLHFGRGGFFLKLESDDPTSLNHITNFEIKFHSGSMPSLEGAGKIKWLRLQSMNNFPAGFGFEISHIGKDCRQDFIDWLEKQDFLSYIPRK